MAAPNVSRSVSVGERYQAERVRRCVGGMPACRDAPAPLALLAPGCKARQPAGAPAWEAQSLLSAGLCVCAASGPEHTRPRKPSAAYIVQEGPSLPARTKRRSRFERLLGFDLGFLVGGRSHRCLELQGWGSRADPEQILGEPKEYTTPRFTPRKRCAGQRINRPPQSARVTCWAAERDTAARPSGAAGSPPTACRLAGWRLWPQNAPRCLH